MTKSEEKAFTNWINKHLQSDPDCKALGLIPIDSDVDGQLYERCKNGIILAKMINVAVPNTIDDRTLEKGESLKAIFKVRRKSNSPIYSKFTIALHFSIGPCIASPFNECSVMKCSSEEHSCRRFAH